jgi:hypothetical protein
VITCDSPLVSAINPSMGAPSRRRTLSRREHRERPRAHGLGVRRNEVNPWVIRNHMTLGLIPTDSEYFKVLQADEVLFPECLAQK